MFDAGVAGRGARGARAADLGHGAQDDRARRGRELPRDEAIAALVVRTRRYAAYQRKWMRRLDGLVRSLPTARRARSPMRSSRWHAHGNVYLVVERRTLTPSASARTRAAPTAISRSSPSTATERRDRDLEPRRLVAEMSGQRHADRGGWLMERDGHGRGARRRPRRRARSRRAGCRTGCIEQDIGAVEVGARETRRRDRARRRSRSATRTPSSSATRTRSARIGPLLETHPRFPERTNVQVARVDGPGEVTARVWERGVGETTASGTSAVAVAAATHGEGDVSCTSPAATSACASKAAGLADRPGRARGRVARHAKPLRHESCRTSTDS